jgi:hypothetical protein
MEDTSSFDLDALRKRVSTEKIGTRFEQELQRDDVKTILIAGCGGGFDFVHSMLLYPKLVQQGKKIGNQVFVEK